MQAKPLGGSRCIPTGLMPCHCPRRGGGRGLPAALQTAWWSTAPCWQGPSATVCSSGMPGAFQTPKGTARPSPPAPAAHAEHAGGRPGSPSEPHSKLYDRQTDRHLSIRSGLHYQCLRSPVLGSSPAGQLPAACVCGAVPSLPCPGSVSSFGRTGRPTSPSTRGQKAEGRQPHCRLSSSSRPQHTPSCAAGDRCQTQAPSWQQGWAQDSSPSFPPVLVAATEKKTFVLTHGAAEL